MGSAAWKNTHLDSRMHRKYPALTGVEPDTAPLFDNEGR